MIAENKLDQIIRLKMKEKNIGNKALSEKTGIALGTLNKIIYGESTNPTLSNVKAIARALDCTLDDLILSEEPLDERSQSIFYKIKKDKALFALVSACCDVDKDTIPILLALVEKLKK